MVFAGLHEHDKEAFFSLLDECVLIPSPMCDRQRDICGTGTSSHDRTFSQHSLVLVSKAFSPLHLPKRSQLRVLALRYSDGPWRRIRTQPRPL